MVPGRSRILVTFNRFFPTRALDIIKGLWKGETFSYQGRHYQLNDVTYGKPYQDQIPIWVAGFLPNKRPLHRAARNDGVTPGRNYPDVFTVEALKKVTGIIEKRRGSLENYDIVAGGETPGDPEKGAEIIGPWQAAGATWWSENINGWRGSIDECVNASRQARPGPNRPALQLGFDELYLSAFEPGPR